MQSGRFPRQGRAERRSKAKAFQTETRRRRGERERERERERKRKAQVTLAAPPWCGLRKLRKENRRESTPTSP
eukprot:13816259-Heterocapsa_arctica.AAC.1